MTTEAYCAPFVRYPVARSTVLGGGLAVIAVASAMVLGAWALSDAAKPPLHLGVAFLAWALGVLCAWSFWARSPVGDLVWSGQSWSIETPAEMQSVPALEVHLDLQAFLWLRLRRCGLRPQWVWLERSRAPERWLDLRRAVYSRPKPGTPGAPHPA